MSVLDSATAFWRGVDYPGTGTAWSDGSGNGHDATIIGAPTWNSEGFFTLNGTDQYFTIPDHNDLECDGPFTVVAVVRAASLASIQSPVAKRTNGAPSSAGWFLETATDGRTRGSISDGTSQDQASPTNPIVVGQIHTVGFVYTSQTKLENILDWAGNGADTAISVVDANVVNALALSIGARNAGAAGFWNGDIYGVGIWRSALTMDQVRSAAQELAPGAYVRNMMLLGIG